MIMDVILLTFKQPWIFEPQTVLVTSLLVFFVAPVIKNFGVKTKMYQTNQQVKRSMFQHLNQQPNILMCITGGVDVGRLHSLSLT